MQNNAPLRFRPLKIVAFVYKNTRTPILVHQSLLIITLKKGSGKTVILNLLPYVGLVHFQGSVDTLKI